MKDWERIRFERTDLTDYVIHFTKIRSTFDEHRRRRVDGYATAKKVFLEILNDGYIRPTFAPIRSRRANTVANTVRGPDPAVCLTEQPLSAVVISRRCAGFRYSGFGVAYHKYALFQMGGRPVIYGSKEMLGKRIDRDEAGFEEGKEIYTGGIPKDLQYLFVQYKPTLDYLGAWPIDWTWEREWRIKCSEGLPVFLEKWKGCYTPEKPVCALVVPTETDAVNVSQFLKGKVGEGVTWAGKLKRIVSLEKAGRMLAAGDGRYGRIETWPD